MEKSYEITEKQLDFLEDFLKKKYPNMSNETRIELVDHLVADFEATTENGNLSQYLSHEIEFIRNFINNRLIEWKKKYCQLTWNKFFSFFFNFKLIPISILVFVFFYFLNHTFSTKNTWLVLLLLQNSVFIFSAFFGLIKNNKIKKLDEIKYLGAEIWLPFLLVQLPIGLEFTDIISKNSFYFTIYASFIIIFGLSAFLTLKEQKIIILEKYKNLLN